MTNSKHGVMSTPSRTDVRSQRSMNPGRGISVSGRQSPGAFDRERSEGILMKLRKGSCRKKSRRLFALFLSLAITTTAAPAQQQPIRFSLHEAVVRALAQNPSIQIANIQAAEAQEAGRIARADLLPRAQAQFGEDIQRFNIESLIGLRIPGISQHIGPFQALTPEAAFSTPIFDLTLWRKYGAARERALAARSDDKTAREETALLVVSQYLAALRASARVRAATATRDLAQVLRQQATDLEVDGIAAKIDVLRASVRLKQDQQSLLQAQTDAAAALYGLSRLLVLAPEAQVVVDDNDPQVTGPLPEEPAPAIQDAFQNRPELQTDILVVAAAEQDSRGALAASLPSLKFQGTWGEESSHFSGLIPDYNYLFTFSVPVFSGGELTAQRHRAALEVAKARQQVLAAQGQIAEQVKSTRDALASARSQVEVANEGLLLAQQEVNLARDRFQSGVTDNVEVISAQDSLATASVRQIDAQFALNEARAELRRAMGQVEAAYTGAGK